MDLSVIIVNWNTRNLLRDCLKSIFKFTKGVKFEIIVVDNGSKDKSSRMVKKEFPQVTLIPNKSNLGFSKANNQGLKIAKGKYLLLLNSDTYFIENSLKKLKEEAEKHPRLGILSPLLLNADQSIQQSAGFFPHLPQVLLWMTFIDDLPLGSYLHPYHIDHISFYKSQHDIDWGTGAALLISKEVNRKVGGLDEGIFMYGEDVEWCFRIKKAGYKVIFSPCTKIIHIGGGSMKQVRTTAFIGEYRGLIYYYKKYKSTLALQILIALLKMGALLRVVLFTLAGRFKTAKAYVEVLKVA